MDENQQKGSRGWPSTALMLCALVLLYILSSGPAITLLGETKSHPVALFAFQAIYGPIVLVVNALPQSCQRIAEYWSRSGISTVCFHCCLIPYYLDPPPPTTPNGSMKSSAHGAQRFLNCWHRRRVFPVRKH